MKAIKVFAIAIVALLASTAVALAAPPKITAETAIVMDAETGQVIYDKDMHKQMHPASITKIMTTILAVENLELEDTIIMSQEAIDALGSTAANIGLKPGEEISVKEAIYAALLPSANEACNGIAEAVSGTMDEFAAFMNTKAKEFGCKETNFTNANGLRDEKHYTTAYDMAKITQHALTNETWREMFGCKRYAMEPTNKHEKVRILPNEHKMIVDQSYHYEGIVGGKTGYTTDAKNTLVTVVKQNEMELIVVLMKCPNDTSRYEDTEKLLDYCFENYKRTSITNDNIPHKASDGTEVELLEPISLLIHKNITEIDKKIRVVGTDANLTLSVGSTQLGTYPLKIVAKPVVKQEPVEEESETGFIDVLLIIIGCLAAIFVVFVLVLYVRKELYMARRRRERREQRRNRR